MQDGDVSTNFVKFRPNKYGHLITSSFCKIYLSQKLDVMFY